MPWTPAELDARFAAYLAARVRRATGQVGQVVQVCVRPDLDQRAFPERVELCPRRGAIGDRWERRTWMYLADGSPDPRVQVAMMDVSVLEFLQDLTGCGHHPGDTLVVDLDLGAAQLPVGTHLHVGEAIIEISDVENDACVKFARHYGGEVWAWIRDPANRARRLRGLFARVIAGGVVRAGDAVVVRSA